MDSRNLDTNQAFLAPNARELIASDQKLGVKLPATRTYIIRGADSDNEGEGRFTLVVL